MRGCATFVTVMFMVGEVMFDVMNDLFDLLLYCHGEGRRENLTERSVCGVSNCGGEDGSCGEPKFEHVVGRRVSFCIRRAERWHDAMGAGDMRQIG